MSEVTIKSRAQQNAEELLPGNQTFTTITDDIGGVSSLEITDGGFKYASAPDIKFNTNIIVIDVSGTFGSGNTLTSHKGTVKTYDPNTKRFVVG